MSDDTNIRLALRLALNELETTARLLREGAIKLDSRREHIASLLNQVRPARTGPTMIERAAIKAGAAVWQTPCRWNMAGVGQAQTEPTVAARPGDVAYTPWSPEAIRALRAKEL